MRSSMCSGFYNKQKRIDHHGMLPVQCRIRAMTMSSRLRSDSLANSYWQDTDEESDEDGQFPGHWQKEYAVHITCNKENLSPSRTTRSVTRIRSRNYPAPTTVSDIDSDDSEVDISKLKGRRAASSPSGAA